MSTTAVLRGFKVPLPVLNTFLLANNIDESERLCSGIPSFYDEVDEVTTLLRNKVGSGDTKTRVFVPSRMSFHRASEAYIAYDWIVVFAQRRLGPGDLADTPPPGFEELRREVLSHADGVESLADDARYQNAVHVVITDEQVYIPPELLERGPVRNWAEDSPHSFHPNSFPITEPLLSVLTRWVLYRVIVSYRRIYETSNTVPRSDLGNKDILEAHLIWTSKFPHRAIRNEGFRSDEGRILD